MKEFLNANRKGLLAVLLAAVVLVGFRILGVLVYDTNDDAIMAGLSYGYYGLPEGNLVYIHPLLGRLLAGLQRTVPGVSWYLLMELGILFASMAALYSLVLDREEMTWCIPALTVLTLFLTYALLFRIQYTKIAGCAAVAGILLLFRAVEKERKWYSYILGLLLAVSGYLLRDSAFFMILIPMSGVGVWYGIRYLKAGGKKKAAVLTGTFVLLFAVCGSLMAVEKMMRDPQWAHYRQYNALRTELMDYGFPDYGENQTLYESIGISEADLELYKSWDFDDPERFNIPVMETLVGAKQPRAFSVGTALGCVKESVRGLLHYDFAACLLLGILLWLWRGDKAGLLLGLYELAALFGTETYLLYTGRGLRERVDAALVLAVLAVLLAVCTGSEKRKGSLTMGAGILLSAAMALGQCPGLMSRKDDAMERYVGAAHLHAAYQVMNRDEDTLYLTRTDELPPDRMPGRQGGFGYFGNIATLGGWLTDSPCVLERYARYGVTNPFRDLVDSEKLRLVSNNPEPVLDYIRAHYALDARLVEVDCIRGEYKVWRVLSE